MYTVSASNVPPGLAGKPFTVGSIYKVESDVAFKTKGVLSVKPDRNLSEVYKSPRVKLSPEYEVESIVRKDATPWAVPPPVTVSIIAVLFSLVTILPV